MNAVRQRIRPIRLSAYNLTTPTARRWQSTEAPAESSSSSSPHPTTPVVVKIGPESKPYRLLTSVILTRAPILTPEPTPYESAYLAYQRRIARALANPFPEDFYFKKGAIGERRFAIADNEREIAAFGEHARPIKKNIVDIEDSGREDDVVQLMDRVSEADRTGDVRSLNRKGDRSLYLLLKTARESRWRFPQGQALKGEALHKAAERDLIQECGRNMHFWIVGRQPVGVFQREGPIKGEGDKVFFFKGHIMAGQAVGSTENIQDFAWLTMEEIGERLEQSDKAYWEAVRYILSR
ncbi:hypothetical protein CALCODRAFT_518057 [Calocera cornea HHB12733]|uniref:Large ribosomal subunit protein mL46 n=1 Tax=Calocera cornea HHB12733 TaxID=1353952 RepID=A0A165FB98_9BASI|nr:hypothetical protein CALCODRAFT_518057 [Calocera cornea HHB12733]